MYQTPSLEQPKAASTLPALLYGTHKGFQSLGGLLHATGSIDLHGLSLQDARAHFRPHVVLRSAACSENLTEY